MGGRVTIRTSMWLSDRQDVTYVRHVRRDVTLTCWANSDHHISRFPVILAMISLYGTDLPAFKGGYVFISNTTDEHLTMTTKDQGNITIGQYLLTRLEQLHVKVCLVSSPLSSPSS
jgi:hypothetical protein